MTREEAIEIIKRNCTSGSDLRKACELFIPELTKNEDKTENEDERIREELIGHCKDLVRMNKDDKVMLSIYKPWLAWLEKQKEQKPELPKPHKGDDNNPYDMQASEALEYAIKRGFGVPFNDGEVYVDVRHMTQTIGNIIRWADEHPKEQKLAECIPDSVKFEEGFKTGRELGFREGVESVKPTEWSEDNIKELTEFEAAMLHIGMSFFGGSAGLNPNNTNEVKKQAKLLLELVTKQEWSEEDEKIANEILDHFNTENAEWFNWFNTRFKSLRPQPKQEWSEEDKINIDRAVFYTRYYQRTNGNTDGSKECIDWLKSLSSNLKKRNEDIAKLCSNEWSEEDKKKISELKTFIAQEWFNKENRRKALDMIDALRPQPKQEWSEEDEKIRQSIIKHIEFERNYTLATTGTVIGKYNEQINWLKSISLDIKKKNEDVAKLCSNEWSEEDEANLDYLIDFCNSYYNGNTRTLTESTARTLSNWLYRVKSGEISLPKSRLDEKDEKTIHLACEFIRHHATKNDSIGGIDCFELVERLKSLRPQIIDSAPLYTIEQVDKKIREAQEWSEEDESFLDSIEDAISSYYDLNHAPQYHYWLEQKLKSLRSQPKVEWSEEQKEQKPVEYLDKDKIYAIMKKLHELAFSHRILIYSDEYKKINEITSDVRSLLDYPIETKPAEWSNLDKDILNDAITAVDLLGNDESFNKSNPNLANAFRVAKDWLETLPERFNVKEEKQEWTKEDENMLLKLLMMIDTANDYEEIRVWLCTKLNVVTSTELDRKLKSDMTQLERYISEARTKKGFYWNNKEVSWEEIPLEERKHDYPYYFKNGLDCYPFRCLDYEGIFD